MPKGVTKVAFINKTFPEGNYILELTITYGENSFSGNVVSTYRDKCISNYDFVRENTIRIANLLFLMSNLA